MDVDTQLTTLERVPRETSVADIWATVQRQGAVVIQGLFDPSVVADLNRDFDEPLSQLSPGAREEWFNVFFGANTKRFTNLVVASRTFRETVLQDPVMLGVADHAMTLSDTYWLGATQVIEIGPGNARQMLHRDMGNYPVFLPQGPDGPEVVINFLIALTEFREDNGATRVIPGSNHWPDFFTVDDETHQPMTIAAEMQPGDALLASGKVIHGGGANATTDEYRRGLALTFSPGFLVPEQAYPFEVPLELARTLPAKTQQLLGFRSFHNYSNLGGSLWQHNYEELADFLQLGAPE